MSAAGGFVGVRVHWLGGPKLQPQSREVVLALGLPLITRCEYTSSTAGAGIGKIPHQQDIYTSENVNPNVDTDFRAARPKGGFSCSVVDAGV